MKICIPVTADRGLESPVSGHFGSAPLYMLVDAEARSVRAVPNPRASHEHGACSPLEALEEHPIDAVLVGGIGPGALAKLRSAGIRVLRARAATVAGCLDALSRGDVEEIEPAAACDHGHGHGGTLPTRS